jgi:hypothetical protein
VTVWVRNRSLNEVGTGGITAPVLFYAPTGEAPATPKKVEDVTPLEFK